MSRENVFCLGRQLPHERSELDYIKHINLRYYYQSRYIRKRKVKRRINKQQYRLGYIIFFYQISIVDVSCASNDV